MESIIDFFSNMSTVTLIIWIIIILWATFEIVQYFRRKNSAVALENDEFNKNLRKAQLIDVRTKDEFDAGHILGARNIPYHELSQRYIELRTDQPIYLYEDGSRIAFNAAINLRKKGFEDLYVLKNGYENWDGRIKRNRKLED
jgi:rhodanese-related sulfurtransferase